MDDDKDTSRPGWHPASWTSGVVLPVAVGVGTGLLLAQMATAVFLQLRALLLIAVVSLFLSFALEPAVQWLARRGIRRGLGTGMVFVAGLTLLSVFTYAMTTIVVDQVRILVISAPSLLNNLADQLGQLPGDLGMTLESWLEEQTQELPSSTAQIAGSLGRGALDVGQSVLGGLLQLAAIALVTFYLVADGPRLRFGLAQRLPPRQQVRVLGVWELAIAKTGGYVYSRLLTATASAIVHSIAFTLLGLPYGVALGIWVGIVSSLIPAVGTYIAGALPVIVAFADSPRLALWVLVTIVVYQQIENYLVVPRITATTLELHPAAAFLSVLAGGALAGATGALLAIPAVAIATSLLSAATEEHDVLEHQLVATGEPHVVRLLGEQRSSWGEASP